MSRHAWRKCDPVIETHFKLNYKLIDQGWAACEVELGDQGAKVTASYLSDALGDLVSAVLLLKTTGKAPGVSFAEEPSECRWLMSYVGKQDGKQRGVRVKILAFDEWQGSRGYSMDAKGSQN